jgi:hypothetical protein
MELRGPNRFATPHLSYTQYLIRIKVRTLSGEVGIGVLGTHMSDLKGGVLVPASDTARYIEINVGNLGASGGIIVRNGSQPHGRSRAQIDSIDA